MKRSLLLSTGTATIAFVAAFSMSRSITENVFRARRDSTAQGGSIAGDSPRGRAASPAGKEASAQKWHDPLLLRALARPSLSEAVKEILERGDDDHGTGARLIALVESLPPEGLAEMAAVLDEPKQSDYAMSCLLGAWVLRDTAAAQAWVEAHPALPLGSLQAFLRGWTHAAPEAALAWVEAMPLSSRSASLREALVVAMAERDPAAALETLQSRGWLESSPNALVHLFHTWGCTDPAGALATLRGLTQEWKLRTEDAKAQTLYSAIFNGAYNRSPAEAAALLSSMAQFGNTLSEVLAEQVFARDPALAGVLFTAHPDFTGRQAILSLMTKNPALVLLHLGNVEDADFRAEVLASFNAANSNSHSAGLDAATLAAAQAMMAGMTSEAKRLELNRWLTLQSAASDPAWSTAAFRRLPVRDQIEVAGGFLRRQAQSLPDAAIASFRACPPDVQDFALTGLVDGLGQSAPEKALPLLASTQNPNARIEAAAHLFALWAEDSAEAAAAGIASIPEGIDLMAVLNELERNSALSIRESNRHGSHTFTKTAANLIRAHLNLSAKP